MLTFSDEHNKNTIFLSVDEREKFNRFSEALGLINEGVSACMAARQTQVPLKELKSYTKQCESRQYVPLFQNKNKQVIKK